jgi:hypothetical protein
MQVLFEVLHFIVYNSHFKFASHSLSYHNHPLIFDFIDHSFFLNLKIY